MFAIPSFVPSFLPFSFEPYRNECWFKRKTKADLPSFLPTLLFQLIVVSFDPFWFGCRRDIGIGNTKKCRERGFIFRLQLATYAGD
jgi:hypothetical protein